MSPGPTACSRPSTRVDPKAEFDIILNLQGDLPAMEPSLVHQCLAPLAESGPHIATIAAEITNQADRANPNSVKVVGAATPVPRRLRALYFTRATAPWGEGPLYHHFGMYAYRRAALERFVALRAFAPGGARAARAAARARGRDAHRRDAR